MICINGEFLPESRATVPVTARGFRFGDGVFTTIRLHQGVPYRWHRHLARLEADCAALCMPLPAIDWAAMVKRLLRHHQRVDGFVRIHVSRGGDSVGYRPQSLHATPFWVIEYLPARALPDAPLTLWVSRYTRAPLTAMPGNAKLSQGITSTLALLEAQAHGCDEALLLSADQTVSCAASANLFWIDNGLLFTPSLDTACLNGITRAQVLRLATLPVEEVAVSLETLMQAEAVFVTNTRLGVWPVHQIGNQWTGDMTHPFIKDIQQRYVNDVSDDTSSNANDWDIHP